MGDISYPLYMVHYPFIYLYYAWVKYENLTFVQSLPGATALVIGSVVLAYICLKLYDEPVRKYLMKNLLQRKNAKKRWLSPVAVWSFSCFLMRMHAKLNRVI